MDKLADLKSKKIGVLYGGTSSEREVSLKSGSAVHKALVSLGYDAVLIDTAFNIAELLKSSGIDIAFIALHGGHGENGAIQGMLEVMGIPYTGSGVLASALAMDKIASKKIFIFHKLTVADFIVVGKNEWQKSYCNDLKSFVAKYEFFTKAAFPFVVKPALEGSSIGVSIVHTLEEFKSALDNAFDYGVDAIIEQFIAGKEVHIAVLNGTALGGVEVRPKSGFYSYEAKYTKGMTEYILPPEIDDADYLQLKDCATIAYNSLGCRGAVRVDFILSNDSKPFILEVNTIPGMTETSLLPKIAALSGLDFAHLVQRMLLSIEIKL